MSLSAMQFLSDLFGLDGERAQTGSSRSTLRRRLGLRMSAAACIDTSSLNGGSWPVTWPRRGMKLPYRRYRSWWGSAPLSTSSKFVHKIAHGGP
jgi:hypothetical protein